MRHACLALLLQSLILQSTVLAFEPLAMADSTPTGVAEMPTSPPGEARRPERSQISSGHKTRGLISLALIGLQVGTGMGLRATQPNPEISLRAVHLTSSVSLLGLGLYEIDELLQFKETKSEDKLHRTLGHTYLGLLTATAIMGFVRVRGFERTDPTSKTLGDIHTAMGVATAGALVGSALTIHFD